MSGVKLEDVRRKGGGEMICVSCGISGDNFKVFNGDFLCSACEPRDNLEIKIKQLEAENAKLKEDLGSWNTLLGDGVSSQMVQDKLKNEIATLKKELEVARKAHLERLQELAKWKALAEKANDERYGLLEVNEGLENQIATLKEYLDKLKKAYDRYAIEKLQCLLILKQDKEIATLKKQVEIAKKELKEWAGWPTIESAGKEATK